MTAAGACAIAGARAIAAAPHGRLLAQRTVELAPRTTEPAPRPSIAPLAAERYKVQFTATADMHDKLRRAQDLLRHRIPNGDVAQVMDLALTLLVEKLERQKLAATNRPRTGRGVTPGSRAIPADVKRGVWKRDGGRCAFIGKNGRHCSETGFLEFHHVVPFAHGGEATIANISLRCRSHNQFEAELEFGPFDMPLVRESSTAWGADVQETRAPWDADVQEARAPWGADVRDASTTWTTATL